MENNTVYEGTKNNDSKIEVDSFICIEQDFVAVEWDHKFSAIVKNLPPNSEIQTTGTESGNSISIVKCLNGIFRISIKIEICKKHWPYDIAPEVYFDAYEKILESQTIYQVDLEVTERYEEDGHCFLNYSFEIDEEFAKELMQKIEGFHEIIESKIFKCEELAWEYFFESLLEENLSI